MTGHEFEDPTPEERQAQEAVRSLPVAGLSARFHGQLEDLFVRGAFPDVRAGNESFDPERVADPLPDMEQEDSPSATSSGTVPLRPKRPWLRPLGLTVAAAAALLIVTLLRERGANAEWALVASAGAGSVWVDEEPFDVANLPGARFRSGCRVRTGEGIKLELKRPDVFALELAPGTDLDLPSDGGGGMYLASVRSGMATWVTGSAFPGHELRVAAPDAEVRVHGTTFAVLADDEKTCVSVLEGEVGVRTPDGNVHPVCAGRCRRVYRTPQIVDTETDLNEGQLANLSDWHTRSRGMIRVPEKH